MTAHLYKLVNRDRSLESDVMFFQLSLYKHKSVTIMPIYDLFCTIDPLLLNEDQVIVSQPLPLSFYKIDIMSI